MRIPVRIRRFDHGFDFASRAGGGRTAATGVIVVTQAVQTAPPSTQAARPANRPRWCRATRLLVAATAAWWLYLVLHWVLSGRFWLWLIPAAAPPMVFLAAPLLLLLGVAALRAIRRPMPVVPRYLVSIGAFLALVAGLPYSGLNPGALRNLDPVPPDAIRVVSWNTQYWHQSDDPDAFYRFLTGLRADVYLLQEYLNWEPADPGNEARRIDDLARLRREFPGHHMASRGELITLSRFPIVAAPRVGPDRQLAADANFAAEYAAAKALRTDLRIGSEVVSVYNVHIPVQFSTAIGRDFLADVRRRTTARTAQLRGLMADIADNSAPILLAGDFNTSPGMGDLRDVRGVLTDATPVLRSWYPVSWQADGLSLWRLDWVFTDDRVRVDRYDLRDPQGLSDHRLQEMLISVR